MTDAALPTDSDPLVSFRQSEWEAYQRYVAGLEGKVSAYERAAPIVTPEAATAGVDELLQPASPRRSAGHTAMYTIGWVFFVFQMLMVLVFRVMILAAGLLATGGNDVGLIGFSLVMLAVIAFVVLLQIRLQLSKRPIGVLLAGIFGPCLPWLLMGIGL